MATRKSTPCLNLSRIWRRLPSPWPTGHRSLAGVIVALALTGNIMAQVPHDECSGAQTIGTGITSFNLTNATQSLPIDWCGSPSIQIGRDLWFCWTAPCSGPVSVSTCGLATAGDTVIIVYSGCACVEPVKIACNDDCPPPCNPQSGLVFTAVVGTQYLMRVGTVGGSPGGAGRLRVECAAIACDTPPPPPTPEFVPCDDLVLRSGQVMGSPGSTGQLDDAIVFITGGMPGACFDESLDSGSGLPFAGAVASTSPASVASTNPSWVTGLDCDPLARWINWSSTIDFGLPRSVLYNHPFAVSSVNEPVHMMFCWAVDDRLGDSAGPASVGVYLQNSAGVVTPLPLLSGGSHGAQTGPISLVLPPGAITRGVNHLLVYQRDIGCANSGVIYSATLCNCLRDLTADFAGDPAVYNTEEQDESNQSREVHHSVTHRMVGGAAEAHFSQQVAANTSGLSGTDSIATGLANYDVRVLPVVAPGEPWCILVESRRRGEIATVDDGGGSAHGYLTPVTGSLLTTPGQTAFVAHGTLSLPDVPLFEVDNGTDFKFAHAATAIIQGVGPEQLALNFNWSALVRSLRGGGSGDGDSIGLKMGIGDPNNEICPGAWWYTHRGVLCELEGSVPSENFCRDDDNPDTNEQCDSNDGHFVTITCIRCVDGYCQDFNCVPNNPKEPCVGTLDGWTWTSPGEVTNPGIGGASGGQSGDGYIRVAEAPGTTGEVTLHAPADFHGKWDCFCGFLEFDVRVFDDAGSGVRFTPSVSIIRDESASGTGTGFTSPVGGHSYIRGTFRAPTIAPADGWVGVRVPLPPGVQPTGSLGTWTFVTATGTPVTASRDIEWLLARVTSVTLPGEYVTGSEILGYDNICLVENTECVPVPHGIVGWWPLDEILVTPTSRLHEIASNTTAHPEPTSSSLGGANAQGSPPADSPSPIRGMVKGALLFDGINDRVVSDSPAFHNPHTFVRSDFTIDAWIKTSEVDREQPIVDKRVIAATGNPVGYRLFLSNGNLALGIADPILSGETIFLSSTVNLADGAWHHVAATVKRTADSSGPARVRLYADCNAIGQFSPAGKIGDLNNATANLMIGGGHPIGGPARYFRGIIDEVEIFNRALSAAEICSIYNAGCAGKCKDFCYAGAYCINTAGSNITFQFHNGTPVNKTFTWAIANGGTGLGCTMNSGLVFTPVSSTSIVLAPYQTLGVTVHVVPPPGMTTADRACFTVTFTVPATGMTHQCEGSVSLCCTSFPPWKYFNDVNYAEPPSGPGSFPEPFGFQITNTGSVSGTLSYRMSVRSTNPASSLPIVSLNGLPPGQPALGAILVDPGQTRDLLVDVRYVFSQPFVPRELVLEVDPEGDGTYVQGGTIGLISSAVDPLCPDEFVDNFDAYPQGPVCGQGGWEEWIGSTDVCATVTSEQAFDGPNSLKIVGTPGGSTGLGDDVVQRFDLVGGRWVLRAQTYVPTDAQGRGWVVMLNSYPSPLNWSLDILLDADNGLVHDLFDAPSGVALVRGRWAPLLVDINIDNDLVNAFYDGQQFIFNKSWADGDSGGGQPRIQALDLYAGEPTDRGTTGMFFDAISLRLASPCPPADCNANGLPDDLEIFEGLAPDADGNGVPDECECLADINDDGVINSQDFFAFLTAFFTNAPAADFNHDTIINSQDFFDFLNAFFAGC